MDKRQATEKLARYLMEEDRRRVNPQIVAPMIAKADLNTLLFDRAGNYILDPSPPWAMGPKEGVHSLFSYFLSYIFPRLMRSGEEDDAIQTADLFLQNGARLNVIQCGWIFEQFRSGIEDHKRAIQQYEDVLQKLADCKQKAATTIGKSPITQRYIGDLFQRAYHPEGPLAQRAWEDAEWWRQSQMTAGTGRKKRRSKRSKSRTKRRWF